MKRFQEVATTEHLDLADRIQSVVDLRNEIAHRYFWDRAVAFLWSDGRRAMVHELVEASEKFDALDIEITDLTTKWGTSRGVSASDRETALSELLDGKTSPQDIGIGTRLPKQLQLTDVYRWHLDLEQPTRFVPLLRTSDGFNLVLSNRGLCMGPSTVGESNLVLMSEIKKARPATVNPRPKNAAEWKYTIPLAKGF